MWLVLKYTINLSYLKFVPNFKILGQVVAEKSLTKKSIHTNTHKYIKLVYNMMLEDLERLPEKLSWAKSVKALLESLGFGHVWLMQGVGDVTMFLNVLSKD